ncbi:lipase family protein [Nocardia nepalensis]|uniref:lipase family protein n=1 Tax=Nocardia nepalensis TaxID=3375448 RepID=UPI003B682694
MSSPTGDQTFDAWPANLAALEPGQIIDARDVMATTAQHMAAPIERAVLLKFRSTSATGTPSFGTATLIIPAASWNGPGPRPVEVDAMPINALGLHCTPGYQLSHGLLDRTNTDLVWFLPAIWSALSKGHAVLLPDHEGPLMAYGETNVAGHMMLDSIRAVRNALPEFGNSRYVVDGYSGGAIAAYATAMLQSEYAPELSDVLMGVASGGLAADYRDDDETRIDYHTRLTVIATPTMKAVAQKGRRLTLLNRHAVSARRGLILSGAAGTGKTTAVTQFGKMHEAADRARHPHRSDRIPVVYVTVPPAATPRMLAAEFARFLGLPVTQRANLTDIIEAVCGVCCDTGTSVVICDELHNISLTTRAGADVSDTLKYFAERIPATFLFSGINVEREGLFSGTRGE